MVAKPEGFARAAARLEKGFDALEKGQRDDAPDPSAIKRQNAFSGGPER